MAKVFRRAGLSLIIIFEGNRFRQEGNTTLTVIIQTIRF